LHRDIRRYFRLEISVSFEAAELGLAPATCRGEHMSKRKPYKKRNDLEKIRSQWNKLTGLHDREEWSAAVVRAATAAELAANFAIRREFKSRSTFDSKFVDSLLRWANRLAGKIDRLLIPLSADEEQRDSIDTLKASAAKINNKRNAIVHQGEFCSEDEAKAAIRRSRGFIETLVRIYRPTFVLRDKQV
jgi:hypothetical protein